MVGNDYRLPTQVPGEGCDPAGRATQVVRVDDIGATQRCWQRGGQGVRGVTVKVSEWPQGAPPQPTRLAPPVTKRAKGDQLAVDVGGQRARQFERITLAAPEQALGTERCWSNVYDAHAGNRPPHTW